MGRTWRILAVLTLFLSGTLVGGSLWMLAHPAVTPFVVRGATDIQVISTGVWEWKIAYDASGPPYAWYFTLAQTLAAQQWHDPTGQHLDEATLLGSVKPLRFAWDDAGVLWDEAVLTPDYRNPQRATITLRRHLRIPWCPWWSPTSYRSAAIARRKLNITLPGR